MRDAANDRRNPERTRISRDEDLIAQLAYLAPEIASRDKLAAYMVAMAIQILNDGRGLRNDPGRVCRIVQ
jgi:hypothetical protein